MWIPDNKKPLLILTYPRSGGSWFQHSLRHIFYDLFEYFNPLNPLNYENLYGDYNLNYLPFTYYEFNLNEIHQECTDRFNFLASNITKIKPIHSIRLHVHNHVNYLEPYIISYLKQNYNIISLHRKDLHSMFWSNLIAYETMSWNWRNDKFNEVLISKKTFNIISKQYKKKDLDYERAEQLFHCKTHLYYEDFLSDPLCYFPSNNTDLKIQNNKKTKKILNIFDILTWAKDTMGSTFSEELENSLAK
jgi:hypothetical protein